MTNCLQMKVKYENEEKDQGSIFIQFSLKFLRFYYVLCSIKGVHLTFAGG